MIHRVAAIALTLAAYSAAAHAQDVTPSDNPPTVEQVAAARAHADQLIATANAARYFENITTDAVSTVLHKVSGMTCAFSNPEYDKIAIYPAQGLIGEGDDVGCNTRLMDVDFSNYATRYARQFSEEDIIQDSINAIRQRWPDVKPRTEGLITATLNDGPTQRIAGYDITISDRPMLTLVLVTHQGEWSFKGRVTGPSEGDTPTNLLGAVLFSLSLPGGREKATP
jgi:hypothetical protein